MRLHRFFIKSPVSEDKFDISDRELVHQWRSVFRYNVGSQVILFDGSGVDYLVIITSLRNTAGTVEVVEKKKNRNMPKINLTLCVGIIKKDNFELVSQKATELGVSRIVPVLCERSEKKNINMERLQKIVTEASEQSGRGDVPTIGTVSELPELLKDNLLAKKKVALHSDGIYVGDFLASENPKDLAVFVGPEGGWSETELALFASNNIQTVSLGTQTLRAETASIAVSSLLLL